MKTIVLVAAALSFLSAPPEEGKKKKKKVVKYTIDTSKTTAKVKKGKPGLFWMHIKPAKGFKINKGAPLRVGLKAEGLDLKKKKLGHRDAKKKTGESPEFGVKFKTVDPGKKKIAVDAMFFVCDEHICEKKKTKVTVPVTVDP